MIRGTWIATLGIAVALAPAAFAQQYQQPMGQPQPQQVSPNPQMSQLQQRLNRLQQQIAQMRQQQLAQQPGQQTYGIPQQQVPGAPQPAPQFQPGGQGHITPASAPSYQNIQAVISQWPQGPRNTAEKMVRKYGLPSGLTQSQMIWENPPYPWHEIIVYRRTINHDFPKPHQDYVEHVVLYEVPEAKFDDLANYDGSVIAERTQGTLAARCHTEWANILALNLAHDVIEGRKDVEEARQAYARAVVQKMQGQSPALTQYLNFQPMTLEEARDSGERLIWMQQRQQQ